MKTEFIKFQSDDKIDLLLHGIVYMKELQYYVDLEKKEQNDIVGDALENAVFSKAYETPSGIPCNLILKNGFCKSFVFCIYEADLDDDRSVIMHESDKIKKFGDYALWIKNMDQFIKRIQLAALKRDYHITNDKVIYYDDTEEVPIEVMQSVSDKGTYAFGKRKKFKYQNEYRFVINTKLDEIPNEDYLILDIGDISDITQKIKTQDLINGKRLL